VPLFSSEIFFLAPCVLGVPLSSSEVFFYPLHFRGASFFIRGLFLSPLDFMGASFFIRCIFEPMSEGSDSTPLLMASIASAWALVEYEANLVSDFDLVHSFGGNEAFIAASGYMGSALLNTSRASPVRKRVRA
jgi:hypothetical protein